MNAVNDAVNFESIKYLYLIAIEGSWVDTFGLSSGVGTWLDARHFRCYADAKEAIDNPSWHNSPDSFRNAEIVRLEISVTPKFFGRNPTTFLQGSDYV